MSTPIVKANAGVYTFEWEQGVNIRVDRVYEDSKHNVTGEITVSATLPTLDGHLHQAKLNLTSTGARKTLAKHLEERSRDHAVLVWPDIIEQTCVKVLELHRQGEPVIRLSEHERLERVSHRIYPTQPEGQPRLTFAYGGSSKTLYALYEAVLVASGLQRCGFEPEPGNVLIVDYEADPDELKERVEWISRGLGIEPPDNIYYRFAYQPLASDIEAYRRECLEKDIELMVIDSASPACGGEPESAEKVTQYFGALRSLKIATHTLAHIPKKGAKNPFGSVFWENLPRKVFKLTSNQKAGDSTYSLSVEQTKVNWGQYLKPFDLSVAFEDNAVTFNKTALKRGLELPKAPSLRERIIGSLSDGKKNVRQISDDLNVKDNTVRTTLGRNKDLFIKIGDVWGCVAAHE